VILFPSLALLFRLTLAGQLGHGAEHGPPQPAARVAPQPPAPTGLLGRLALACLIAGFGLLTVAGAGWAHALGLVALAAFVVLGVAAMRPGDLAAADEDGGDRRSDPVRSG
jgi:cytochrome d ubiquinol oxidase subunit II